MSNPSSHSNEQRWVLCQSEVVGVLHRIFRSKNTKMLSPGLNIKGLLFEYTVASLGLLPSKLKSCKEDKESCDIWDTKGSDNLETITSLS